MAASEEYVFEMTDTENNIKFYFDGGNIAIQNAITKYTNQKIYVFRKMSEEEFKKTVKAGGFVMDNVKPSKARTAEKWYSEAIEHTQQFNNRGVQGNQTVAEVAVDKPTYEMDTKKNAIPQSGSRNLQPREGRPFNVTNTELLDTATSKGKVNVGLKGVENVEAFNKSVLNIRKIDPDILINENAALTWLRRNKLAAGLLAVGVVVDAASLVMSFVADGCTVGKSTAINVAEIVGGVAGAEAMTAAVTSIAGALNVVIPGIGIAIGAMIGAIIGALIAGGLMSFFLTVPKSVAGPGPPIPEFDPYPDVYGVPETEVNPALTGPPELAVNPAPSGAPPTGFDTNATGFPDMGMDTRPLGK